jgi:hypothetical protein
VYYKLKRLDYNTTTTTTFNSNILWIVINALELVIRASANNYSSKKKIGPPMKTDKRGLNPDLIKIGKEKQGK